MIILPYKMGSRSSRALSLALGIRQVYPDRNFRNNYNHRVLNWGRSSFEDVIFPYNRETVINKPHCVARASNKLDAFRLMRADFTANIPLPDFTDDVSVAQVWLDEGITVVRRAVLRGHSGEGISLHTLSDENPSERLVDAPLFTKYIKKTHEYRVHIMKDRYGVYSAIDVQMKRKRRETPNEQVDYQVRNHSSGWVYCREGVVDSPILLGTAMNAIIALGLDFGAVDIIYNERANQYYVLEVNTACGLEGESVNIYANAIRDLIL